MNLQTTTHTTMPQSGVNLARDMNSAFKEELKSLIQSSIGPCVSIYMPTHRAGMETQQSPIRLSNLIRLAEERLIEYGMRPPDARELLSQANDMQKDSFFWRSQADGLATFISPTLFRTYRLPLHFDELVVVSDRFHFKPFLRMFNIDGFFYVLAISQKGSRLLECTRYGLQEIDLSGLEVPKNIDEALKYDDMMSKIRFHTRVIAGPKRQRPGLVRGGGPTIRDSIFRGHGAGVDDTKTDIMRYLIKVDDGLREVLKDERAPLVLAGVDYLLPLYVESSSYQYIFDEGITGNPDGLSSKELHEQAWALVEPYFRQAQKDAEGRYMELAGTGLTTDVVAEAVSGAYFGRVDTLFVSTGVQRWGAFNPENNKTEIHGKPHPGDEDLLDLAAVQTFLHGGTVYAVDPEEAPGGGEIAAILRY